MSNRRGFTLVEILIAMIIMLMVTGSVYKLLISTQRLSRAQAERVNLQSNVRTASLVVPSELREMTTVVGGSIAQNDILEKDPDRIVYRAMRSVGFVCSTPTTSQIRIARSTYSGYRDPVGDRDSLYVFIENAKPSLDRWLPLRISNVTTSSACAAGGNAITLTIDPVHADLLLVPIGAPVRIYEVMELKVHSSDGQFWLGARSVSGLAAIQPVLGPLANAEGLLFEYLDANSASTADKKAVKSIRVTVRGVSDRAINSGGVGGALGLVQEQLVTEVALRNAFAP